MMTERQAFSLLAGAQRIQELAALMNASLMDDPIYGDVCTSLNRITGDAREIEATASRVLRREEPSQARPLRKGVPSMASLLDSLTEALTPDVTKSIGQTTGLDGNLVSKGLGVVGPLVLGALARRASTPSGLDGLSKLIPQDKGAGLGNLLGMVAAGGATPSTLSGLFGAGLSAVGGTLDRKLGFKASSLIGMVVPVALGLLSRRMSVEKLDRGTLARTLQDEHQAMLTKGGETASLVRSALDAGDRASELKARFAADQWTKIRLAPGAAAKLVMLASPSGPVGVMKEAKAAATAIAEAKAGAEPTSLIGLAFDAEISREEVATIGTDRATALGVIKDAMNAVAQHSPPDVPGYSKFVRTVATMVAEGTKEGGFLGIGGTPISKEEQAVVDEIDLVTGAPA